MSAPTSIVSLTLDLGATGSSAAIDARNLRNCSLECSVPGADDAAGTYIIEASVSGDVWGDLAIPGIPAITNVAGAQAGHISMANLMFPMIRVTYTRTSGSGTMTIKVHRTDPS